MKIYYLSLIIICILFNGCNSNKNIEFSRKVSSYGTEDINLFIIEEHEYLKMSYGFTHSGTCKKCKYELDSIVKNAVNEAFEANMEENWNE